MTQTTKSKAPKAKPPIKVQPKLKLIKLVVIRKDGTREEITNG